LLRRTAQQKVGSSCGVLMLVGGGCSGESCSGRIRNFTEKGTSEHLRKPVFLHRWYSIHAEHQVGVDQLLFCYVWHIFLSVMLDRRPCITKLLNSLSLNPPKSLLSVFYFPQSKIKYRRSKSALREILLLL
jgi:hypothetical protein